MKRRGLVAFALAAFCVAAAASAAPPSPKPGRDAGVQKAIESIGERARAYGLINKAPPGSPSGAVVDNFTVLGHNDLGAQDSSGDVWVHEDFAYVGTWSEPCTGRGVKVVDVSDLTKPRVIGAVASRPGTSAEDVVVRSVSTPSFTGDLLAVGLQRCGSQRALDKKQFGPEFWDVTDPYRPRQLSFLGVTNGGGGVHELDLFQRGSNVYALLATPFSEFFDPVPGGDFRIVDVTNPRAPIQVGEWGAFANGFAPGPFFGFGSFGASFDHSARVSADGMSAYVSYWDLGVLTLDISDPTNPTLVGATEYPEGSDGDAHSVSEYIEGGTTFLLQNDEDFDPRSPARVTWFDGESLANESPSGPALWEQPGNALTADVVMAAGQGCFPGDYPPATAGKIAVARTPFPFFDSPPPWPEEPLCLHADQEAAAEAAGAAAIVHAFVAEATSPQWFDIGSVDIPVLFTDEATADSIVAAGSATLTALEPSWGFIRVFDAATGDQVAKFDGDGALNVHEFPPPFGFWSIHNNEVIENRSYASWYTNGVVALDLSPLTAAGGPNDPEMVGQFVPPGAPANTPDLPGGVPIVWGVAIRDEGPGEAPTIFVSDINSGLWIVRPTGPAAP